MKLYVCYVTENIENIVSVEEGDLIFAYAHRIASEFLESMNCKYVFNSSMIGFFVTVAPNLLWSLETSRSLEGSIPK